ncbi:MAG: 50S ribosomal protein L9 [Candidatus Pacebacteria bacterium]|nr:50S ribosomal protein L9 [Candidatus Paceibacterota bacterium]
MKVILLRDVPNTGRKHDIKEVSSGFARNFLIPKGLAIAADEDSLKNLEMKKRLDEERAETELKETEQIASKLDGTEVEIQVKSGKEGQLFESVNKQKVSDHLKEMGFNVSKDQVDLKSPLKETGEFPVKLKFDHNLEAEIRIIIKGKEE